MATTKYLVRNGDELVATKSKKAQAIELAQSTAKELRAVITVSTEAGNEVFVAKARKEQIKTTPYTRLVDLPESYKIPEGARPCYTRARKNAVILHFAEADKGKQYQVRDFVTGRVLAKNLPTTRAAGRFLADEVELPEKVSA